MTHIERTISIVMPCLNEETSVAKCVRNAKKGLTRLKDLGFPGEIIVVDNGSTDRSISLAKRAGAKVVVQKEHGYGAAYQKGIRIAKGKFIVIGDSDGTYDFGKIPLFIAKLLQGVDLVLGSRFKGKINEGSMSFLHKYVGNPILTIMINLFYGCNLSDSQTGFRAFTKDAYRKMQLKSKGMDFASEMILKAIAYQLNVAEIPIDYYPRAGHSKLSPIKDAWKHITSILIYSPTYAFIFPGLVAFTVGAIGTIWLLFGSLAIGDKLLGTHTMTGLILLASLGVQIMLIGFFARLYTVRKLGIKGGLLARLILQYVSLEKLFLTGIIFMLIAGLIIGSITFSWITSGFPALAREREFIAAAGLGMIGGLLTFSSFLFGLLQRDI